MTNGSDPHQHRPEISKRLRRAEGHLKKIIEMVESGRPCLELAQQLQAVENALGNAKKALIHDHIDHCLEQSARPLSREGKSAIEEFKMITKYL